MFIAHINESKEKLVCHENPFIKYITIDLHDVLDFEGHYLKIDYLADSKTIQIIFELCKYESYKEIGRKKILTNHTMQRPEDVKGYIETIHYAFMRYFLYNKKIDILDFMKDEFDVTQIYYGFSVVREEEIDIHDLMSEYKED